MKYILVSRDIDRISDAAKLSEIIGSETGEKLSYQYVYPEEGKYKIAEIKKLTSKLIYRANDMNNDIAYVLPQGDQLTPICQNALLKTLEESRYSIVLLVKNIDSLLPTVRSRCQVKFVDIATYNAEVTENERIGMFTFDEIPSLAKLEREKVRMLLESELSKQPSSDFTKILALQKSISMIEANCKVESVLIDLLAKIQKA